MSDIKKRLGRRVRELRKKGGFTISQLAEAADLSDNYVGFIERGVRTPTIETLAKLACALKTDISELFYFFEGHGLAQLSQFQSIPCQRYKPP